MRLSGENSGGPSATGNNALEKRPYNPPVLQCFGAVTALTGDAVGSCMDDSTSNICPPDQNMQMNLNQQ